MGVRVCMHTYICIERDSYVRGVDPNIFIAQRAEHDPAQQACLLARRAFSQLG